MTTPHPFIVVILTALPIEFAAVSRHLTARKDESHMGTVYQTGVFIAHEQQWKVAVAEIGAGDAMAAAEAQKAIAHFNPSYIFFVGVAGGVKDVKLGDVVFATKIYAYESGKDEIDFKPRPELGISDHNLVQWARRIASNPVWHARIERPLGSNRPHAKGGPIAAGSKVVASTRSATHKLLKANYSDTLAVEMEGYGFLTAARVNHPVQAIVIRGISDLIDKKAQSDAQGSQEIASQNASAFAFELLAKLSGGDGETKADGVALDNLNLSSTALPPTPEPKFPISQIPYRKNPNFVWRDELIGNLKQKFEAQTSHPAPQVITGLPGVGKTQVAVEYGYRFENQYDLVALIRAEEDATLSADYQTLINILQLPLKAGADQPVMTNIIRNWLEQTPRRWLLILDNVVRPENISDLLPKRGNGHIIITSNYPDWHNLAAEVYPLKPFGVEEGSQFLLKRVKQDTEADKLAAKELSELLQGLPLALEQAAAFITRRGSSLNAYIKLYKENRAELRKYEVAPPDHKTTLADALELTIGQLQSSSPASLTLLNIIAFLAPDNIPLSIFQQGRALLPVDLAEKAESTLALEDTTANLYQYSLVERQSDTLSIHRLVQEIVSDRLSPSEFKELLKSTVKLMDHVFLFDEYKLETWSSGTQLLPHAISIATYAEQDQTAWEAAASIWQKSGELLRRLGDYPKAQSYIEKALNLRKQVFGNKSKLAAVSQDYLGELLQEQVQFPQALEQHQAALEIYETLSDQGREYAKCLNNLGHLFYNQGKYDQALVYYQQALDIRRRTLGEQHPDVAASLGNIGIILRHQGKYDQALIYQQQSLALSRQILGEQHPHIAISLGSIGNILHDQGKYDQALIYQEQSLALCRQILGERHPDVATALNDLAVILLDQEKHDQALVYFEQALALQREVLGERHPHVATSLGNLGSMFRDQGKFDQALIYQEQSLALRRQVLGEQHPDVATTLGHIGITLFSKGKTVLARQYIEKALAMVQDTQGENHPNLIGILSVLAQILVGQRQFFLARKYIIQALAICAETEEQYAQCERLSQMLKGLPGAIGGKKRVKKKDKKKKH